MQADAVRNWRFEPGRQKYAIKDTILYALGAGAGADSQDLPFVYEAKLRALPTMAAVLAGEGPWMTSPQAGIDYTRLLHGEQRLEMHRPLANEDELVSQMAVDGLYDRGPGKGAVLVLKRELRGAATGDLVATVGMTAMLMGDGGFGGDTEGLFKPPTVPEREPDIALAMPTRPDQAALYRLSGDYNPLHIDPELAVKLGFERPILHGLCSYAVAGRAILRTLCNDDPSRLRRLDVRFSAPVYPGETLNVEIWKLETGEAAFRCTVVERDVIALNNGVAHYSPAAD